MDRMSTVPVTTGTLQAPGAQLYYEMRGTGPVLILIGNPMDANPFTPLAELLATDHTVVTTDPRGINRSPADDPTQDVAAELRAEDLSRLLAHLATGPAAVFGSSGGAVSALALAAAHPDQVHTVVAHEPPLHQVLADRDQHEAAVDDMIATYLRGDIGCIPPPDRNSTLPPCGPVRRRSSSASGKARRASCATGPPPRSRPASACSPPSSPAGTSGSSRTPTPSRPASAWRSAKPEQATPMIARKSWPGTPVV